MSKVKFIVGTILFALAVVMCALGSYLMYYCLHITDAVETFVVIFAIPFGIICYTCQVVLSIISEILLWKNFHKNGCCKVASLIIAILGCVALAFTAGYLCYIFICG